MHHRKVALHIAIALLLVGIGTYILIPTPDELIIYPSVGGALAALFNLPLLRAITIVAVLYRGIGVLCLLTAIIIGGRPIYRIVVRG